MLNTYAINNQPIKINLSRDSNNETNKKIKTVKCSDYMASLSHSIVKPLFGNIFTIKI